MVSSLLVGEPYPIPDINDPHIQELGVWAISEHNKQAKDALKFKNVTTGDEQVVEGFNYWLIIDALNSKGKDSRYKAVVWEREWENFRNLTSFAPVN
ncbi:hypothetical protein PR202_ga08011 [Eleusine coracana subsp. coracana]|uniref:Cystatin domain-containing protein n=1 Tax=Eleusine coracana subsp. coracana TaxID=191504 RepID=A0AAV5C048_ELECO|nr:hypothetical protein PR202_ga08011 [Eleusine coracana subsp. coracana]